MKEAFDFIEEKYKQRTKLSDQLQKELADVDVAIYKSVQEQSRLRLKKVHLQEEARKLESEIIKEVLFYNSRIGGQDDKA